MGSSYKEATHNNNVLYYKLHGLVSNMKIVKFNKPNQILILFFLWHICIYRSISTLHNFQLKKKTKNSKTNAVKHGSTYNLVDIEGRKRLVTYPSSTIWIQQ